ncbi:PfkB family carbohydrate kinase [Curtobacterium flaccumfaciens]|nr:PfkB family carbohydrate kinase [Curtobacterium flaccumfaciens]
MRVDTGGAESNVAIGLARAGVPTTWIGRVGTDPAGDRVVRDVRSQGVDVVAVPDADRSTGIMMKERLADGRTRVTYHRRGSAGSALRAADLPERVVERAALLHVTGITLALSDDARAAVGAAIDRADTAGVPVSFDVNHRPKPSPPTRHASATVPSPHDRRSCSPETTRRGSCSGTATTRATTRRSRTSSPRSAAAVPS